MSSADHIIRKVAEELKKRKEITPPAWAAFAKTGAHKEMPPEDPDWWYVRVAAVLRRVYVDGPLGVERMRSFYGGKKNRGSKPNAFRKGSGSILRKSLQQLEAAGLIIHDKTGRKVSPAGMAFLDNLSQEVKINSPGTGTEARKGCRRTRTQEGRGRSAKAKGEQKAPREQGREGREEAAQRKPKARKQKKPKHRSEVSHG